MKHATIWRWPSTWGFLTSVGLLLLTIALRSCAIAATETTPSERTDLFHQRIARLRAYSEPYQCRRT